MSEKREIRGSELHALLNDDDKAEKALESYFEIDDSQPFHPTYRVRADVTVTSDAPPEELEGILGDSALSIANRFTRQRRLKRYRKAIEEHPERRRVVSEGDSWFQHPMVADTIDNLANHYAVYSVAAAGDELHGMFRENEYMAALRQENAKVLLLSGGGNDLMGGRFGDYLNEHTDGDDPGRFLNDEFFAKVNDLMNLYRVVFTAMQRDMPNVRVLTHGYDYVVPGEGKKGKWLGKPMTQKGIRDEADRRAVIRVVIDEFNSKLSSLTEQFGTVDFVDVRGTVREGQWYDEIHPNDYGFQQVAVKFIERIN